ncbi:MAG: SDR family oxidoreductase [Myxococcota bacterium]
MGLLNSGGRFIELGKAEIWEDDQVRQVHPSATYTSFDLANFDPALIQRLLATVSAALTAKQIQPLPQQCFSFEEVKGAFRHMAQAKHVGKVVLTRSRAAGDGTLQKGPRIGPTGSYLVTGGLGYIGRQIAHWLVAQGAQDLVLIGRRPNEETAQQDLQALRTAGATVRVLQADVGNKADLRALIEHFGDDWPALHGVFHAAGVLADAAVSQQTWSGFERVLSGKVDGARWLDRLTRGQPLDHFVLFSSVAAVTGSPGQSNYAAANAALDALAHGRRAAGLCGLSINWGPWAGGGMAARVDETRRWKALGISPLSSPLALALFEAALAEGTVSQSTGRGGAAQVAAAAIDRWALTSSLPLLSELAHSKESTGASQGEGTQTWNERLQPLSVNERLAVIQKALQAEAAKVLGLTDATAIDVQQPLREMGLDSLMAVELRNALGQWLGTLPPVTVVFDYPTIARLSQYILEDLSLDTSPPVQAPRAVTASTEPVAIVGMGCRFPNGANTLERFWTLLEKGDNAVVEVPSSRWDIDAFYDPDPNAPGKMVTRWGGFLDDVDQFDCRFFGVSPREAAGMDPQQRLLLETSWEALEQAGITTSQLLDHPVGVYVGMTSNDYSRLVDSSAAIRSMDAYSGTGNAASVAAGRLSYFLGLRGPAMAIDTACSSSLVAVHLACQALRSGDCEMALAGGVNLILTPESTVYFSRLGAMSPDGLCKSFDASADGYVRSEGCGVVVLKRLSAAQADGDRVLGVISGSAVNQDGRSNGLTAPNGPAQQEVIRRALAQAQIAPADVSYVEAHATGTALGDPIEVQALSAVLGENRASDAPVILGSVKSNIGHTEGAAGVAGLIKAVLALNHEAIPKSLHFNEPNPHIPWERLPVVVAQETTPWPRGDRQRVAGVSSFGFSGTNAHVIVTEAPQIEGSPTVETSDRDPALANTVLLPLSAKHAAALPQLASATAALLEADPATRPCLRDVLHTATQRRTHHPHRLAVTGDSASALAAGLHAFAAGQANEAVRSAICRTDTPPATVFVFPGHGSQWCGMGRQLYTTEPVFRAEIDAADTAIRREVGWSLVDALLSDDPAALGTIDRIQPTLWALQIALAQLWQSWGVIPDAVVGHSMGEVAAAYVAGALSLDDAARIVCQRSKLLLTVAGQGAMAVVELSAEALAERLSSVGIAFQSRSAAARARRRFLATLKRWRACSGNSQPRAFLSVNKDRCGLTARRWTPCCRL